MAKATAKDWILILSTVKEPEVAIFLDWFIMAYPASTPMKGKAFEAIADAFFDHRPAGIDDNIWDSLSHRKRIFLIAHEKMHDLMRQRILADNAVNQIISNR